VAAARRAPRAADDACGPVPRRGVAALRSAAPEAALVAFALLAYFGVRLLARDGRPEALANAWRIVRLETALHCCWERPVQQALLEQAYLVRLLNWVYVWGHWPVLAACVAYLYVRRRDVYRRLRTSMIISGLVGLLFFMSFPVAPPRLAAATGVRDTIKLYDASCQEVARPSGLTNQYAAMPSFHVGWTLLCGVCVAMTLRRRGSRAVALGLPLLMGLAVVVTGNHYIVDGVVGAALAMLGLAVCVLGRRHRERHQDSAGPEQAPRLRLARPARAAPACHRPPRG
jgi:membrane-associated phospholipid phosphatase